MTAAVLALRALLATVFVTAGVGKLLDVEGSRRAARDFGVPERAADAAGLLLPLAELLTAAALILRPSARWAAVAALVLLLLFIVGIANALRRGQAPDCHCFGQIHSAPAGPGTLVRNGVLAAMAIFVVVKGPGPAVDSWLSARTAAELAAIGLGASTLLLAAWSLQQWTELRRLRLDLGTAQRMAALAPPGIPIGSQAPTFSLTALDDDKIVTLDALRARGNPVLLVFVSPGCGSCVELLPKVRRWQQTLSERLTIALVSTGAAKDNQPIADEHGFDDFLLQDRFEVAEAYRVRATPSAVIVTTAGDVGSNPAESVFGIEPLLRLALRDGAGSLLAGSLA